MPSSKINLLISLLASSCAVMSADRQDHQVELVCKLDIGKAGEAKCKEIQSVIGDLVKVEVKKIEIFGPDDGYYLSIYLEKDQLTSALSELNAINLKLSDPAPKKKLENIINHSLEESKVPYRASIIQCDDLQNFLDGVDSYKIDVNLTQTSAYIYDFIAVGTACFFLYLAYSRQVPTKNALEAAPRMREPLAYRKSQR